MSLTERDKKRMDQGRMRSVLSVNPRLPQQTLSQIFPKASTPGTVGKVKQQTLSNLRQYGKFIDRLMLGYLVGNGYMRPSSQGYLLTKPGSKLLEGCREEGEAEAKRRAFHKATCFVSDRPEQGFADLQAQIEKRYQITDQLELARIREYHDKAIEKDRQKKLNPLAPKKKKPKKPDPGMLQMNTAPFRKLRKIAKKAPPDFSKVKAEIVATFGPCSNHVFKEVRKTWIEARKPFIRKEMHDKCKSATEKELLSMRKNTKTNCPIDKVRRDVIKIYSRRIRRKRLRAKAAA